MVTPHELYAHFQSRFGGTPVISRAPGRINLIGEHTDYNQGFVFPAAIQFSCWVAAAKRNDRKLVLYSENFSESAEADLDIPGMLNTVSWSAYPVSVALALEQAGYPLHGANLYVSSDVPLGAGLSSSAAIEVSTARAHLEISGHSLDRRELALLCQRAENDFVGARCGIMDQFISTQGIAGCALVLDCRSLEFQAIHLPQDMHLVICNTRVKHENASGEYNARRSECETAVTQLAAVLPGVASLRDVTISQLEQHRSRLTDIGYRRARHVITENARVHKMAQALQTGQRSDLAQLMVDSHRSLRDDYEVSCPELDLMVEIASRQRGLYGARMTGGGFGGCTINLVKSADAPQFQRSVGAAYERETGLRPDIYICTASSGAEIIHVA